MKLYRNAIILVVLLCVLAGAYLYFTYKEVSNIDNTTTEATTVDPLKIFKIEKAQITELTVNNKEGKLVFAKTNETWTASYPVGMKTNSSKVDELVTAMAYLSADKVIEENATDLVKYGLDKPIQEVSVKTSDGVESTVQVGNMTSTKDGYYAKKKDSNTVYTLGEYTGGSLLPTKSDFRDKFIFSTVVDDITKFTMEKKGQVIFVADRVESDNWAITAPIEANGDMNKLLPVLTAVVSTNVIDYIEENPTDLGKYGLNEPAYSYEVVTKTGTIKVLIGDDKVKGSEIYAMVAGGNEVFTMDEKALNFLDKPLNDVMEVFAYITNITNVSKIVVEMDGQTVVSEIQTDSAGDTEKDTFRVDGKDANMKDDADKSYFRKYYSSLIGVTMSDVEVGTNPVGTPEITFTYSLKSAPGTMKIEFISKDNYSYYVMRNGKYTNMLVAKKDFDEVDGVRDSYKKLVEAMEKSK